MSTAGKDTRKLVETQAGNPPRRLDKAHRIIYVAFVLLCLITSLVNPLGEGYDEWAHFAYSRHLVTERTLPESGQRLLPEIAWDATHHPPLYYLIGAAFTCWVDMTDDLRPIPNPEVGTGRSLNAYIHTSAEQFPYTGSVLGMHAARMVSTLMGLLTLILTHKIARNLAPERPTLAAAATAITGFMPQFVFTHSIITNDAAVTLFSTLTLFFMVRLLARPHVSLWLAMWLAIAAAFMSKANAVALIPLGAIVSGWVLLRQRHSMRPGTALGLVGVGLLVLTAELLLLTRWESWNTYLAGHHSSLTGAMERFILPALAGGAPVASELFDWSAVPAGLAYTWRTFWAAFGVGNVPADEVFYWIVTGVCVASVPGLIRLWRSCERAERWRILVPLLAALLLFIPPLFLIPVSRLTFVSPGRYLMPAAPIVGLTLASALARVLPGRERALAPWVLVAILLVTSAVMPWRYIAPAYAQARILTEVDPSAVTPLQVRFGDNMELIGYRIESDDLAPGDRISVALYWRCLHETRVNYTVSVQVLDPELIFYGGTESYPGHGSYPTSLWQPGQIIEDRHSLLLGEDLPVPTYVQIKVTVFATNANDYLPANPAGELGDSAAVFGRVPIGLPSRQFWARWQSPMATYGGSIGLLDLTIPATLAPGTANQIDLTWRAQDVASADYVVFAHLVDAEGTIIAQADGPPINGRYPTSLWRTGEVVRDTRMLEVPAGAAPGQYRVLLGWYLLETGERLPAADRDGALLAQDAYVVPVRIAEESD